MVKSEKIGFFTVLRAHWGGTRGRRLGFVLGTIAFALNAVAGIFSPIFFKQLLDGLTAGHTQAELLVILYTLTAVSFLGWLASRVGYYYINSFEAWSMAQLLEDSLGVLLPHSFSFYQNNFTGSLVQKVRRFSTSFEKLFDTLILTFIPFTISVIGILFVVYQQMPVLSYIMIGWIVLFVVLNYTFTMFRLPYDIKRAALDSETTGVLADIVTNQNAISLFATHERETETFANVTRRRARAMMTSWNLATTFDGVQSFLIVVVTFVVFYYSISYWSQGLITLGTFALVQLYLRQISDKMWDFGRIIRQVYEAVADSREMVEIMHTPYDVYDLPGATKLTVPAAKIEFANVTFNYNETRKILSDVELVIEPGQKIALVGPSGAGKTTFVRLLLRLYDVTAGQILVDGQDIKHVTLDSLHKNISLVPQEPVLFHRSLMENIRYGRLDATDEEVIEAARLAHCAEFIEVLPEKYNTFVGERGIKLSGGERQRVAIARAMLKNAPILILDEATSSLDSHSESMIQDALNILMKGKTVLVIAHRLSTIRMMDRILVIDDGQIREDGTHDELLKNPNSLYKALWELQAGGFLKEQESPE